MTSPLYACAVCFGANDNSGIAQGLNWGIFVLLTATCAITAAIGIAVYKIEKAREAADAKQI